MIAATQNPTVRPKKPVSAEIKWLSKVSSIGQIYASGLEYCFIAKDNRQVCPMVFCKDFLQDALWAWHNKQSTDVYGFCFDRKDGIPICLNQTRIAIGNTADPDFSNKIPAMLAFLNEYERKLRLMRTTAIKVTNPPSNYTSGIWLLQSSRRWMIAPPMLSLYSLLIRVGFRHELGRSVEETTKLIISGEVAPYQDEDEWHLECAQKGIAYILRHGYTNIFYRKSKANFPKSVDVYDMHEGTGIVAFSSRIGELESKKRKKRQLDGDSYDYSYDYDRYAYAVDMPHWYRKLTTKKKAKVLK